MLLLKLVLAFSFVSPASDFDSDTELSGLKPTPKNISLFTAVEQLMDLFSDSAAMNEAQNQKTDFKNLRDLWEDPLLIYQGRPLLPRTEGTLSDPHNLVDFVFTPLALASFRFSKGSEIDLRFKKVLRKINLSVFQNRMAEDSSLKDQVEQLKRENDLQVQRTPTLPFPMLTPDERRVLSMCLGAYLWRYRGYGGYSGMGTNDRRHLFVAVGFAQIARINGAELHELLFARFLKLGVQLTSWGRYHDLGRAQGSESDDLAKMEKLGGRMVKWAKLSLPFPSSQSFLLSLAGKQMGRCYQKALESIPASLRIGEFLQPPLAPILMGPSNFGELCTGAGLGLAIATTFQKNKM